MKTIEEAAEEYADRVYPRIVKQATITKPGRIVKSTFQAGADFALANQWVSAEDRLPPNHLLVIVRDEFGDCNAARWNANINIWQCENSQMVWFRTTITHWMPIPELNTEEQ